MYICCVFQMRDIAEAQIIGPEVCLRESLRYRPMPPKVTSRLAMISLLYCMTWSESSQHDLAICVQYAVYF